MAYELLKRIAGCALPMTVTLQGDVEDLRVLRDAGYVKADIPPRRDTTVPVPVAAVVTAITPLGRTAMRYFGNR